MIRRNQAAAGVILMLAAALLALSGCGGGGGGSISTSAPSIQQLSGSVDRLDYTGEMTVLTSAGEGSVSDTGNYEVEASTENSCLGLATTADGELMLLGWLGGAQTRADTPSLSAHSTAEVLLFYGLGAFALPQSQWEQTKALIAQAPETDALAQVIGERLRANPKALAEGDAQIIAALDVAIGALSGGGGPKTRGMIVEPQGQSGVEVNNLSDANTVNSIEIVNNYRRRAWAYVDHVKDYVKQGSSTVEVSKNVRVTESKLDSVTGLNGTIGTITDILTGNMAYEPKSIGPFQLPATEGANVVKSEFRVIVVGPGNVTNPNLDAEAKLTQEMRDKRRDLTIQWFFCDFALPIITAAMPWQDANLTGLGGMDTLMKDLATDVGGQVPSIITTINDGNYQDALNQFIGAVENSGSLRQVILNRILAHVGSNASVSPEHFLKVQGLLTKALNIVNLADRILAGIDIGAVLHNTMASRTAEMWTVQVTQPEVVVSPDLGEVNSGEATVFSAVVKDGAQTVSGNVRYTWSLPSNFLYGTFKNTGGVEGAIVTTSDETITFKANDGIEEEKTGTITCKAEQLVAGEWKLLGSDTATLKIKPRVGKGRLFSMTHTVPEGDSFRTTWVVGVAFDKVTGAKSYKVHGYNYNDPAFWGTQFTTYGIGSEWSGAAGGLDPWYEPQRDANTEYVALTGGSGPGDNANESVAWGLGRFQGGIFDVTVQSR